MAGNVELEYARRSPPDLLRNRSVMKISCAKALEQAVDAAEHQPTSSGTQNSIGTKQNAEDSCSLQNSVKHVCSKEDALRIWNCIFIGVECKEGPGSLLYCAGDIHKEEGKLSLENSRRRRCAGSQWNRKCPGKYHCDQIRKVIQWAEKDHDNRHYFITSVAPKLSELWTTWHGKTPLNRVEELVAFCILLTKDMHIKTALFEEAQKLCQGNSVVFLGFVRSMLFGNSEGLLPLGSRNLKRKRCCGRGGGLWRFVCNWYNRLDEEELFLEAASCGMKAESRKDFRLSHRYVLKQCHVSPKNQVVSQAIYYLFNNRLPTDLTMGSLRHKLNAKKNFGPRPAKIIKIDTDCNPGCSPDHESDSGASSSCDEQFASEEQLRVKNSELKTGCRKVKNGYYESITGNKLVHSPEISETAEVTQKENVYEERTKVLLKLRRPDEPLDPNSFVELVNGNLWLKRKHIPSCYFRNEKTASALVGILTQRELLSLLPSLTVHGLFLRRQPPLAIGTSVDGSVEHNETSFDDELDPQGAVTSFVNNPSLDVVLELLRSSERRIGSGLLPEEVLLYWRQYDLERGKIHRANKALGRFRFPNFIRYRKQADIASALKDMYHNSFADLKSTDKRLLFAMDVRPEVLLGYQYRCKPLMGFDVVRTILLRALYTEPNAQFFAFLRDKGSEGKAGESEITDCDRTLLTELDLNSDMDFDSLISAVRKEDHSITVEVEMPVELALQEKEIIDCFVVITTCKRSRDLLVLEQTLAEYRSKIHDKARYVLVLLHQGHLETSVTSIDDVLVVEGFDKYTPEVIWKLAGGEF